MTSCSYVFTSRLRDKYCCDLFRADACDISSNQASRHQKMGLQGNNSWCLGSGFYCKLGSFCGNLDGPGALATILLYVSICYLCLLHLYLNQIFLWSTSSAPWWSQWTKKTDRDIAHNDYCIFIYVATICVLSFLFFHWQ